MGPQRRAKSVAITVVDDEPLAQDVLIRAAQLWDYDTQAACTAEAALELLERRPTPIVVTDLRMPGKGGVWLIREVRRRWPHSSIIVITAGHDPEGAIECLRAGANHYFFKPINIDEFHHVLETAWRTVQLEDENRRYRTELELQVRRQTRRVRQTFLSAINSLARTMEERDAYTAGHSLRVRNLAVMLANQIGLEPRQRKKLSLAAKLHDIGKVAIPEAILNKPGPLTWQEERVVREHPLTGYRILTPIIRDREVLRAIRGHHERLDGTGYPDGLRGGEISVLARLITIPDVFDALTTSRAYRKALPAGEALNILRAGAGTHFDPVYVRAFTQLTPHLEAEIDRSQRDALMR